MTRFRARFARSAAVAVSLLAASALGLVLFGGCVSLVPFEHIRRAHPEARFIDVDGGAAHVEIAGEGQPLVLLHGFGESTYSWRAVMTPLAAHHRVVAIDLYGFGWTERPTDPNRYTLAAQERLVLGVMDALGIARADVAGHSYGGGLALLLASEHPERVDRLLLVDNALPRYSWTKRRALYDFRALSFLAAHTTALTPSNIRRGLLKAYFDPAKVDDALVTGYLERLRVENEGVAFYGLFAKSLEPQFQVDLATIAAPALVVWGREDRIIEESTGRKNDSTLAHSTFVDIPRCGHSPMEECPTEFLAFALPFLDGATAAGAP